MASKTPPDRDEIDGIQVDFYGIRTRVQAAGAKGERPKTWREVATNINNDLKVICVGIFSFLSEVLVSATRLVRGIGRLPDAFATRVEAAHRRVEEIESTAQLMLEADPDLGAIDPERKREALQRVAELLVKKTYRVSRRGSIQMEDALLSAFSSLQMRELLKR